MNPKAVAVVVDPIQSVRGKVVIDAFRLINPQTIMMGYEPRQTTSNIGHLEKPSLQVNYFEQIKKSSKTMKFENKIIICSASTEYELIENISIISNILKGYSHSEDD